MTQLAMIDDDKVLCTLLEGFLQGHGFALASASRPSEGLELIERVHPRLVILDVMLPEKDGFSLIRELRATKPTLPMLMLSARGETVDRILGLELGADDYLTKPFEPRELLARIKAILSRAGRAADQKIISGDIVVDPVGRVVKVKGAILELTSMEYDLLVLFVQNAGRKFTRDEILTHLHEADVESYGRAIDSLVNRLRRKLEKHMDSDCIRTVWGVGYVYVERNGERR